MLIKVDPSERLWMRLMRIGGVALLLLGPLMFYLSLRGTATNHYEVPIYFQAPPQELAVSSATMPPATSIRRIACLTYNYPYNVFEHPAGGSYPRPGVQAYLMHNVTKTTEYELLVAFYRKSQEYGRLQVYAFYEDGLKGLLKVNELPDESQWARRPLSAAGLSYFQDCVLRVPELFAPEETPENWAMLLDSAGRIRAYFDPKDGDAFRDGLAAALILMDIEP